MVRREDIGLVKTSAAFVLVVVTPSQHQTVHDPKQEQNVSVSGAFTHDVFRHDQP